MTTAILPQTRFTAPKAEPITVTPAVTPREVKEGKAFYIVTTIAGVTMIVLSIVSVGFMVYVNFLLYSAR